MPFLGALGGAIGGFLGGAGGAAAATGAGVAASFIGGGRGGGRRGERGPGRFQPRALFPGLTQQYTDIISELGPQAFDILGEFAKTGMPTDFGPAFEAIVGARDRFTRQGRENIAEMFGASGLRFSSPLMNALVDFESQTAADYGSILAQMSFGAQESARQRQLQSAFGLFEGFAAPALSFWQRPVVPSSVPGIIGGLGQLAGGIGGLIGGIRR